MSVLQPLVLVLFLILVGTAHAAFPKVNVWVTCGLGQCSHPPHYASATAACFATSLGSNPEVTNLRAATTPNPVGQFECIANFPGCMDPNGCGTGASAGLRSVCPLYSSGTSDCTCTPGFLQSNSSCSGGKNNGDACPVLGNPCNPANGNKVERQVVYRGLNGFHFELIHNSFDTRWTRFGQHWRDTFDRSILMDGANAVLYRQDGRVLVYTPSGGAWVTDADTNDHLVELQNPPGTRIGWELSVAATDDLESYDAAGKLTTIRSRSGLLQTLTYSDGTTGPNGGVAYNLNGTQTTTPLPTGVLIRASDHFGRTLNFAYNAASKLLFMSDPGGGSYQFGYTPGQPLSKITYPDNKVRTYVYSEVANTSGVFIPGVITGIVDENADRFATFQYDTQRRSIATEHAGTTQRYTFSYAPGATTVTDPLNVARTYSFQSTLGAFKNTGITGPVCPSCGPLSKTHDANGSVSSQTDWNGNKTTYVYDLTRNLETSRTEALTSSGASTPQTRTISTEWHPTFRLATRVAEPLRLTTFVYDPDGSQCGARGAVCTKTVQATTDVNGSQGLSPTVTGLPRTRTYTYNANGHVLTVNGPRTDVSDVTTYTYYPNNHTDLGKRGNLATISNALGHLTSITQYNAHGQPLTIVDPNGMTITLAYDARQRLETRNVGGEVTSYDYDDVGQLIKTTLPDGSHFNYEYDEAHRLKKTTDNLGNRIEYQLDPMGNRTLEQIFDQAGVLVQKRSRTYSTLNRVFRDLGAEDQITEYGYDDQGNVVSVKDPLNHVTSYEYDGLNRVKKLTSPSPVLAVTQYAYNGADAITQVTDARNLVTGYTVDGLGNVAQRTSPDTGTTSITYDAAGNPLSKTDAKGDVRTYVYDALNRVTSITYTLAPPTDWYFIEEIYTYDQGTNGIGRLTGIAESDGWATNTNPITYTYDQHGRISDARRVSGGGSAVHVIGYSYDSFGRLSGMTYPGGRTLTYGFDALGRINQISTAKGGQSQTVVQNVTYHPFGGVKGYTLGNGRIYSRSIDLDGRIASYTLGAQTFDIGYDDASRISDLGNPGNAVTYGYDNLNRLTSAVTPSTAYGYVYDAVGNRTSRTAGASTDTYTINAASNRIAQIATSSGTRTFVYDAIGSTLDDGKNWYSYDDPRSRPTSISNNLYEGYTVFNALGQRTEKIILSDSPWDSDAFHYDLSGRLISETTTGGSPKREFIYLGDIPVGVLQ